MNVVFVFFYNFNINRISICNSGITFVFSLHMNFFPGYPEVKNAFLCLGFILVSFSSSWAQFGGGDGDGFDMIQISQTLGVSNKYSGKDFAVFPNPVLQGGLVRMPLIPDADYKSVRLVNQLGDLVPDGSFMENNSYWLPTEKLTIGSYVLQIQVGKEWICQTLVVK